MPGDDAAFMLFDTVLAFDHVQHRILVIANARISGDEDLRALYQFACAKIALRRARARAAAVGADARARTARWSLSSNQTQEQYEAAVRAAKEHIAAGDIYQVVLSQRFEAEIGADPFTVYRALRHVNPSPYMFFVRCGPRSIVGSSPEMLVRVEGRHAVTHPIAGTRPRGRTPDEDQRLADELKRSEKERAEHVMLVDLGRNDLGRVSAYGTRAGADLHEPRALLARDAPGVGGRGAARRRPATASTRWPRASRPARSRARRRCGRCRSSTSSSPGRAASTPARSAISTSPATSTSASPSAPSCSSTARAYVQAGAGIVADSNPTAEYDETRDKARAMLRALELARTGL